jgi:hypothetical protein
VATQTQTDIEMIKGYAGQNERTIVTQIVNDLDVAKDLEIRRNLKAPVTLNKFTAEDGFRPNDTSINEPAGKDGKMSKRKLTPRTGMKILKIVPEELRDTYISEFLDPNAKALPPEFGEYYWKAQFAKFGAEINNNCFYGVDSTDMDDYDATVTYQVGDQFIYNKSFWSVLQATTAGQTPISHPLKFRNINNAAVAKGPGTIIKEEYASMSFRNKITTGVLDDTNAFDKITKMYTSLPEEIRALGGEFNVSQATYDKYMLSALTKFTNGTSILQVPGEPGAQIYGSGGKWMLKPRSWMSGSNRIFATLKGNLVMGTDQTSAFSSIGNIVPFLHGFYTIMKVILAFQFKDLEVLFVNDQE